MKFQILFAYFRCLVLNPRVSDLRLLVFINLHNFDKRRFKRSITVLLCYMVYGYMDIWALWV